MKVCTSCKVEKEFIDFGNLKTAKDGLSPCCRECRKIQGQKHKARQAAYDKEYRKRNLIRLIEGNAKWRKKNKESQAKYKSEWGKRTRDDRRETERAYRATDKGSVVAINKNHTRDARVKSTNDGTITTEALLNLKEEQNHNCYHCGEALDYKTLRSVHLDHLIPLSKGGQHTIMNVAWSCAFCNLSKGSKISV